MSEHWTDTVVTLNGYSVTHGGSRGRSTEFDQYKLTFGNIQTYGIYAIVSSKNWDFFSDRCPCWCLVGALGYDGPSSAGNPIRRAFLGEQTDTIKKVVKKYITKVIVPNNIGIEQKLIGVAFQDDWILKKK